MDSVTEVFMVTPVSVTKDTQELIVMVGLFVNRYTLLLQKIVGASGTTRLHEIKPCVIWLILEHPLDVIKLIRSSY